MSQSSIGIRLLFGAFAWAAAASAQGQAPQPVGVDAIHAAMEQSRGYNLLATTNGPRFQSEVLLRLAAEAEAHDPQRRPLFIGYREWFEAYLRRTGLTADKAPLFVRLAVQHAQDTIVDYRREKVLEGATDVNPPRRALNVCIWWPKGDRAPDSYSYEDLLSTPQLKVTNERVITYRLLDLGDMVVFNEITGLRGRPTTGILGVLFQLIGEGSVVESRIAVAPDGLQITRARARKLFEVATTVTVQPSGHTDKDLPPARPDLSAIDARLRQPLKYRHPSMACGG